MFLVFKNLLSVDKFLAIDEFLALNDWQDEGVHVREDARIDIWESATAWNTPWDDTDLDAWIGVGDQWAARVTTACALSTLVDGAHLVPLEGVAQEWWKTLEAFTVLNGAGCLELQVWGQNTRFWIHNVELKRKAKWESTVQFKIRLEYLRQGMVALLPRPKHVV